MSCINIATNAGMKVYIGASSDLPTDMEQTSWEGITSWTQVQELASIGPRGPSDNVIDYQTLEGTICKQKGATNFGTASIRAADVPTDPGQQALASARQGTLKHPFKVEYNDAVTTTSEPTVEYFPALVASWNRTAADGADSIREREGELALDNFKEVPRDDT